ARSAPARGERGPKKSTGNARTCRSGDYRPIYPRSRQASPRVVLPGAPARAPTSGFPERETKHKDERRQMTAQTLILLSSTTGIGFLMVLSGLNKNALEVRRRRRICPSCGREIHGRSCDAH